MTAAGKAFTLAELLIALSILGIIAIFTIPKVLSGQQDGRFNAIAKEAAGAIGGAIQAHQKAGRLAASTNMGDLMPYINYVALDTVTRADHLQTLDYLDCSTAGLTCLRLHNGAILRFMPTTAFGGTGSTNGVLFEIDPDGKYSGSTTGPGKAIQFWIFYNGRVTTRSTLPAGAVYSDGGSTYGVAAGAYDPPWFSWN